MTGQITFGRVGADEARIYQDGDHVGIFIASVTSSTRQHRRTS